MPHALETREVKVSLVFVKYKHTLGVCGRGLIKTIAVLSASRYRFEINTIDSHSTSTLMLNDDILFLSPSSVSLTL